VCARTGEGAERGTTQAGLRNRLSNMRIKVGGVADQSVSTRAGNLNCKLLTLSFTKSVKWKKTEKRLDAKLRLLDFHRRTSSF
jgi:hypothetical protein